MKRAFSFFAAMMLIFAAGCEKQPVNDGSQTVLPKAFSCVIEAEYKDVLSTAEFTQTSFGNGKIRFLTPEILKPLELTFTDEKCNVVYDSLEFETDPKRFPQAEFCSVLIQTLVYTETGIDIEKTVKNGVISYRGSCEHGVFVLKQDAVSGALTEFESESYGLYIKFKDFKTE